MKEIIKYLMITVFFLLVQTTTHASEVADYLILGDIAPYQRVTQTKDIYTKQYKSIPGYWINNNAGILAGSDHFQFDHDDVTYKTKYQSKTIGLGMEVEVTQHTGGDSDRWLLHEIEDSYRDGDNNDGRLGLFYGASVAIREINGNKLIYGGLGGAHYRWLNNNIVIDVSYTDLRRTKPEPLEVVKAYLAKFPSTITTNDAEFKSSAYNVKWIKDEIDRRLWLCDKWNAQYQAGGVTQANLMPKLIESMNVFLNYRQKYYNVSAEADINAFSGYLQNNNLAAIQTKLSEYKDWWNANKAQGITLQ